MMGTPEIPFAEFAKLYYYDHPMADEPEQLRLVLRAKAAEYTATGFFMLECRMMDSSRFGERVILPFGGKSTHTAIPDHPVSPRGLASDMSVAIAWIPRGALEKDPT